jgi:hypothetical protein
MALLHVHDVLKASPGCADRLAVSDDRSPLQFLNRVERVLLGPLVTRLFATGNPRFERALQNVGPKATARMACVNALRIYAVVLFIFGTAGKLAHVPPVAYGFYGLAAAVMAWSFWCLYTVLAPEREYKRRSAVSA